MPSVPDSLHTEKVSLADISVVFDVYHQCEDFLALGPQAKASLEMAKKDIETAYEKGGVFKSIYVGKKIIGVINYIKQDFEGNPSHASLELLMIIPSYRGRGIGTKVVDAVEKQILKDRRVTAILSGVQTNNPHALRFWQKNGYRVTSGPEPMPDGTTVFHLRKDINL